MHIPAKLFVYHEIYSSRVKNLLIISLDVSKILKMGMMPRIPQPESEGFGLHRHPWHGQNDGSDVYKIKWAGPDKEMLQ